MPASAPTTNHHEIQYWANTHDLLPVEIKEHSIDHNPAILQVVPSSHVASRPELRVLSWEEFFLKFDALGLAFVYDTGPTQHNEILQIADKSPYRHAEYRSRDLSN